MAKNPKKTDDAPIGDGIENDRSHEKNLPAPPPPPEKITPIEDLGIGAGDPYPTTKEGDK
jgi:hypothetical protein